MTIRWTSRKHRLAIALALVMLLSSGALLALRHHGRSAASLTGLHGPTANFALLDPRSGQSVALSDFRDRAVVVLVFLGIDCPIAELYLPRLAELSRGFAARDVVFLGINSNARDPETEVAEHARSRGIPFPVLKDVGNRVADQLQVERMCEVFVLDRQRWVCYRGAIDDQYQIKARKQSPTVDYLASAVDAVLAGCPVRTAATQVFGCPIERERAAARQAGAPVVRIRTPPASIRAARERGASGVEAGSGPVTFAEHIAPILQEKCQSCHRPGQVGPFPLLSYDQARRRKSAIREAVADFRMPPWHADPQYGRFENDRSLTPPQRAALLAWIDQGTPEGDPGKLPPPRVFPVRWNIGTPDVVFKMPEPYRVQAEGTLSYRHFRVPTQFAQDTWVQAAEVLPGAPSVIHHLIVYVDDHDPNKEGHYSLMDKLVIYVPGDFPSVLPAGSAKRVPAGSDLILELHYTPNGTVRIDQSSVGLIFAKGPVQHRVLTKGINNRKLVIPPQVDNFPVQSTFLLPSNAHLLSLMPHMHLRGKDFQFQATYPDGTSEILLSVPAYDFAWQSVYRLAEPKPLPRGTRIDCLAHYDNSPNNPANPDPTQTVRWGEQSSDEMIVGYIDFYFDGPQSSTSGNVEAD